MRKRKFAGGIVALCIALSVAGCGKTSEEKQAANYYQKELGLDKDEAEELAHEIYGKDKDEEKPSATEAPEETVIEPLPEIVNSEWWEGMVQALDMIFPGDGTLTEEDIQKIVAGSAYDVEIKKDFDSDGNLRISALLLDGGYIMGFDKSGDYYVPSYRYEPVLSFNPALRAERAKQPIYCYNKKSTEFMDMKTRDDVLAWIAENNFAEVEESQVIYSQGFYKGGSRVIDDDRPVEFADTPHYYCKGVQEIELFRMHKLSETDQEVKNGSYRYSGSHTNLVDYVRFTFNTDGTISFMLPPSEGEFEIMGAKIE